MGYGRSWNSPERRTLIPLFLMVVFVTWIEAGLSYTAAVAEAGLRRGQSWTDGRVRRTERRITVQPTIGNSSNISSNSSSSGITTESSTSTVTEAAAEAGRTLTGDHHHHQKRRRGRMFDGSDSRPDAIVRHYRLYNRCSNKHLRIYGGRVDSLALPTDIYGELLLETRGSNSQLTIQGSYSKNYLCFNKKGRLAVKHSVRNKRCVFHEIYSHDHYTEFQSATNRSWTIGFGSRGQRLNGDRWTRSQKMRKCFQFLKIDLSGRGEAADLGPRLGRGEAHRRRPHPGDRRPRLRHAT